MNNSTQNATNKTYDVHTTGFGYLNRIREVTPSHGGKPYLSCDITLQEGVAKDGDFSTIKKIYFQANVVGTKAIEVMREHFTNDQGKVASPDEPVTAAVRLGGIDVDQWTYQKGDKAGQPGVTLKTRLLKLTYLAIGGNAIDLGEDEDNAETAQEPSEEPTAEAQSEPELSQIEGDTQPESESQDEEPEAVSIEDMQDDSGKLCEIHLSKDDPEFDAKRVMVKQLGYRWNSDSQSWLPPVQQANEQAAQAAG